MKVRPRPASAAQWMAAWPAQTIKQAMETLARFEFVEPAGRAQVVMTPVGVAGLITPWWGISLTITPISLKFLSPALPP